jgi:hypothetical protein
MSSEAFNRAHDLVEELLLVVVPGIGGPGEEASLVVDKILREEDPDVAKLAMLVMARVARATMERATRDASVLGGLLRDRWGEDPEQIVEDHRDWLHDHADELAELTDDTLCRWVAFSRRRPFPAG